MAMFVVKSNDIQINDQFMDLSIYIVGPTEGRVPRARVDRAVHV